MNISLQCFTPSLLLNGEQNKNKQTDKNKQTETKQKTTKKYIVLYTNNFALTLSRRKWELIENQLTGVTKTGHDTE